MNRTNLDLTAFQKLAGQFDAIPLCRTLLGDAVTPVSAFRRMDQGKMACLFESVVGGEKVGRYSFLAANPIWTVKSWGQRVRLEHREEIEEFESENPLDFLRNKLQELRVPNLPGLPPFNGGAVGYAGYDVVRYVESLPHAPTDDRQLPDMCFSFYDEMLVLDHIQKTISVLVLCRVDEYPDAQTAYEQCCLRIERLIDELNSNRSRLSCDDIDPTARVENLDAQSNLSQDEYEQAVARAVEYIHAGDIFQVVLSQRLQMDIDCDPLEIYRTLRVLNPSPFMFYLRTDECTLVGSSPEIMCRVVDREVTVRPLAGTRPRGANESEDKLLQTQLLADPKERAEHVMLVDLGRNDVGRVAQIGTVELPDLMVVEKYSHVMHISSTVVGRLRDDCDAFDALMASLPAGTVSGAPKVRAMEIIDELEPHRRGPYAGAVGYIDVTGNMDTCIALRTIVIQDGIAFVQAGAGVVAESQPTSEYQETLNKARALLSSIELTRQRVQQQRDEHAIPKSSTG